MDLVDTVPDVRYWSKILTLFHPNPHLLTDLKVKATDLAVFKLWMLYFQGSPFRLFRIFHDSSFKYKNLGGSASIP